MLVISRMVTFTYSHVFRGKVIVPYQALRLEDLWGWTHFNLSSGRRWVVTFTSLPLYPPGKDHPMLVKQEAGLTTKLAWSLQRRQKSASLPGIEISVPDCPTLTQSLYWLSFFTSPLFYNIRNNWMQRRLIRKKKTPFRVTHINRKRS